MSKQTPEAAESARSTSRALARDDAHGPAPDFLVCLPSQNLL